MFQSSEPPYIAGYSSYSYGWTYLPLLHLLAIHYMFNKKPYKLLSDWKYSTQTMPSVPLLNVTAWL